MVEPVTVSPNVGWRWPQYAMPPPTSADVFQPTRELASVASEFSIQMAPPPPSMTFGKVARLCANVEAVASISVKSANQPPPPRGAWLPVTEAPFNVMSACTAPMPPPLLLAEFAPIVEFVTFRVELLGTQIPPPMFVATLPVTFDETRFSVCEPPMEMPPP